MFSRAAGVPSSDRPDFPPPPEHDFSPPDGYEFDAKRQRLLHASSDILSSYYSSPRHGQHPYSSSSSVLQSSIVSSLNSYFASDPPLLQQQQQFVHGSSSTGGSAYVPQASASGMYSSSPNPYHIQNNHMDSVVSDPDHFNCTDIDFNHNHNRNHNRMRNSSVNRSYLNDNMAGNPNHRVRASSPSSNRMLMPSYQSLGSSSSLSTSLSPFQSSKSPFARHHHLGPPSSPPYFPSPAEKMSPRALGSSQSPFFRRFPSPPVLPRIFPAVRLRGLPFNCSESDVHNFFRGLDVVDVLLLHKHGRFSGEAYCVFGVPMQVELALRRNKQNMGQRYIEVFRTKKHDYYLAVATQVTCEREKIGFCEAPSAPILSSRSAVDKEHMEHTGILKLRGLPFSASKKDVKEFFKDSDLKDEDIHFVVHSDGRATGEAYVEFKGPAQSKQAMSRDKMMLGSRYVELFPSSREEMCKAMNQHKR